MRRARAVVMASFLLAGAASAQVEVVEPGAPGTFDTGASAARTTPAPELADITQSRPQPASSESELFYQMQVMQEELMKLRGLVEEQGEQLRQLKQQRLDDYISLDRRLGALGGGSVPPSDPKSTDGGPMPPAAQNPEQTVLESGAPSASMEAPPYALPSNGIERAVPAGEPAPRHRDTAVPTPNEERSYQNAYELVRDKEFAQATTAFNDFLAQFPSGAYAGNAHYWLGELYLLEGDSAAARKHFETLINEYPDNRKIPDGMFKLGRIYDQDGQKSRAKEMLERVVKDYAHSGSSAPRMAADYLKQNF